MRLTPAGEVLLRHAVEILARLDVAADEIGVLRRGAGGRLRVGSFATANAVLVPAALAELRRVAPGVQATVVEALTGSLVASLRAGTLDLAVVIDHPTGVVPSEGVDLVHLCDDPLLVALPPGHRLAGEQALDLGDLAGESWIEAGGRGGATVRAAAATRAGFVPRTDITVPGWTAKEGFVAAGLGVTLVPALAAPAMRPDLVLRPVRDPLARRRVFVARPPTGSDLAAGTRLTEILRAAVADGAGTPGGDAGQPPGSPTSGFE